jgi:hypothetical protein
MVLVLVTAIRGRAHRVSGSQVTVLPICTLVVTPASRMVLTSRGADESTGR